MNITCKKCGHQFKGDKKTPKAITYTQVRQVFRLDAIALPKCPQCGHQPLPPKRNMNSAAKPLRTLRTMSDVSNKTEMIHLNDLGHTDRTELDLSPVQPERDEQTEQAIDLEPLIQQQLEVQAMSEEPVQIVLDDINDLDRLDFSAIDFDEQFKPRLIEENAPSAPRRSSDLPSFEESGGSRGTISGLISIGMATLLLGVGIYRTVMTPNLSIANDHYIQEASFAPAENMAEESGYDSSTAILSPSVRKSEEADSTWLDYVHAHMGDEHMVNELFPKRARMSSDFGYRVDPFTKAWKFHHGLDIAMKHGEKVRSLMPGKVLVAGHKRGYGRVVMVEHEHGLVTVYAHLSKVLVKKGASVASYQPVGRVGMTGRATGPHLHFEVQLNGKKIDPNIMPQLAQLTKKKKR